MLHVRLHVFRRLLAAVAVVRRVRLVAQGLQIRSVRERCQSIRDFRCAGQSLVRIFPKHRSDQFDQLRRDIIPELSQSRSFGPGQSIQVFENRHIDRPAVRGRSANQFEQGRSECVDVSSSVDIAAVSLLRSHVIQRAEQLPDGCLHADFADDGLNSRESEVQNLQLTLIVNNKIARLNVAMDDALLVSVSQPSRRFGHDLTGVRNRQRTELAEHPSQVDAVDLLHDQVRSVAVLPRVGGSNDGRVVERPDRSHFPRKSVARNPMLLMRRQQNFQSNISTKMRVSRRKDDTHPAATDHVLQFVVSESRRIIPLLINGLLVNRHFIRAARNPLDPSRRIIRRRAGLQSQSSNERVVARVEFRQRIFAGRTISNVILDLIAQRIG